MYFAESYAVNVIIYLCVGFFLLYLYFTRNFDEWKSRKVPQIEPVPIFGNVFPIFSLQTSIHELLWNLYKTSTERFLGFFICDKPCLLIRDPELVKHILIKDFNVWNDRTITEDKKGDPMSSYILLLLRNPDWKQIRKRVSPIFTSTRMKQFFSIVQNAAAGMMDHLNENVISSSVIEIRDLCSRFTTDSITATTFGLNAECFTNENSEFRKASHTIFNWDILERAISTSCYFIAPTLVKLLGLKFVDSTSANFLRKTFWNTIDERERTKTCKNDVIDFLIDIKNNTNEDDPYKLEGNKLVAQSLQFFTAGFETSATTISFTLYELAKNPELQDKVRKEIDDVKLKYDSFSYEALKEMTLLDRCIKETLRKYPPLPFLDRNNNQDYKIPGTEIVLRKGTSVFISCLGLHYDPDYYPEPEKYDPDRFLPENLQNSRRCTWLPFGDGPRNCFGARYGLMTSAIGVARILEDFEVAPCEKTQKRIIFKTKGFLLSPIGGLHLELRRLKKNLDGEH